MAALKRRSTQKLNRGSHSVVGTPKFLGITDRRAPWAFLHFCKPTLH
jgi:hypothetical protein